MDSTLHNCRLPAELIISILSLLPIVNILALYKTIPTSVVDCALTDVLKQQSSTLKLSHSLNDDHKTLFSGHSDEFLRLNMDTFDSELRTFWFLPSTPLDSYFKIPVDSFWRRGRQHGSSRHSLTFTLEFSDGIESGHYGATVQLETRNLDRGCRLCFGGTSFAILAYAKKYHFQDDQDLDENSFLELEPSSLSAIEETNEITESWQLEHKILNHTIRKSDTLDNVIFHITKIGLQLPILCQMFRSPYTIDPGLPPGDVATMWPHRLAFIHDNFRARNPLVNLQMLPRSVALGLDAQALLKLTSRPSKQPAVGTIMTERSILIHLLKRRYEGNEHSRKSALMQLVIFLENECRLMNIGPLGYQSPCLPIGKAARAERKLVGGKKIFVP